MTLHPSGTWTSRKLNRTSRYAKKDKYFSNSALKVEICPYILTAWKLLKQRKVVISKDIIWTRKTCNDCRIMPYFHHNFYLSVTCLTLWEYTKNIVRIQLTFIFSKDMTYSKLIINFIHVIIQVVFNALFYQLSQSNLITSNNNSL